MKYLFRFILYFLAALTIVLCLPLYIGYTFVLWPLWHLRWPKKADFSEDWVSWHTLTYDWPLELWQRLKGTYQEPDDNSHHI